MLKPRYNKSKEDGKYQEMINQVPHLTQDTIWESDKTQKHHIQESKEVKSNYAPRLKSK